MCAIETFTRGKPRKDKKTGEIIAPKESRRSGATVNRHTATLSHLFSFAVKERRLIDRNPVGDIRRKKEARDRMRFLSDEERTELPDACASSEWPPLYALVLLAITTGAHRGEFLSLKWTDMDLKAGRTMLHDTKNGEHRTLPLAGKALEAQWQLKHQNSARREYLFPSPTVVLDPKAGKPQLDSPYEHFDAQWCAVPETAGIRDFRFHDLRHTTASVLAAQGATRSRAVGSAADVQRLPRTGLFGCRIREGGVRRGPSVAGIRRAVLPWYPARALG